MMLSHIFFQHVASPAIDAFPSSEELDAILTKLYEAGTERWPAIRISPELFTQFLARQLPPEAMTPQGMPALHIGDLYLVCALGAGHPDALAAFESDHMPEVRRTLLKIGTPAQIIPDIIQALYSHLLERQNAPRGAVVLRRGYAGRGELRGWLCSCAVHEAGRLHKRERREVELEHAPEVLLCAQAKSPEAANLTAELKALFEASFREAVAALTSRERNLLRYHFLTSLSIDQIGALYHVHRATAARWIAQAREKLAIQTRERFLAVAPTHAGSFSNIIDIVRSQLDLNLANLLKQAMTNQLPSGGTARE